MNTRFSFSSSIGIMKHDISIKDISMFKKCFMKTFVFHRGDVPQDIIFLCFDEARDTFFMGIQVTNVFLNTNDIWVCDFTFISRKAIMSPTLYMIEDYDQCYDEVMAQNPNLTRLF